MNIKFFVLPIVIILFLQTSQAFSLVESHNFNLHPLNITRQLNPIVNYSNIQNYTSYVLLSKSQLIGIQLSQACLNMIKHNIKSECLTYDKIKQFDNTDPRITGHWINDTWYHKAPGKIKNTWKFGLSTKDNYTVQVDPDAGFASQAKLITAQSGNFTYINSGQVIGSNHTRTEYYNFYPSACESIIVAPDVKLVEYAIKYLESGCTLADLNYSKQFKTGDKPVTMKNPYSTLIRDSFLKTILNGHLGNPSNHTAGGLGLGNCINFKCPYTDPYKKAGW